MQGCDRWRAGVGLRRFRVSQRRPQTSCAHSRRTCHTSRFFDTPEKSSTFGMAVRAVSAVGAGSRPAQPPARPPTRPLACPPDRSHQLSNIRVTDRFEPDCRQRCIGYRSRPARAPGVVDQRATSGYTAKAGLHSKVRRRLRSRLRPGCVTGASRVRHGCATVEPRLLRVPTANRLRAICLATRRPAWIIRFHSLMSSEHIAHCPLPATLDHRTTP